MKLRIEFDTDNAAFEENGFYYEVDGVLDRIRRQLRDGYDQAYAKDTNGNTIGHWSLEEV